MRIDIAYAAIEADMSLTDIAEEAIDDWLKKRKFRRPGT